MTDAKEMERLQASLEKIVGTTSRSLQRTASKRPMIGDGGQSSNKSLLSGLMGMHIVLAFSYLTFSACPASCSTSEPPLESVERTCSRINL